MSMTPDAAGHLLYVVVVGLLLVGSLIALRLAATSADGREHPSPRALKVALTAQSVCLGLLLLLVLWQATVSG